MSKTDCKLHGQHESPTDECWLCAANRRVKARIEEARERKRHTHKQIAFRQLNDNDKE